MLISIIIPCYNVENYIEDCVESVINQTYADIEIICIDNNSSDATGQKLENLQNKYPQLIIDKETQRGAPAARNKGLALASGQWLQFLDADDLLMPCKIENQMNHVAKNRDVVFIAGAYFRRNLKGKETFRFPERDNPFKSLFVTKLGITGANLWNTFYVKKIGGWDKSLKSSQEADLMFRLLQQNENVIYDNEPLTIVRERASGQISKSDALSSYWQQYFEKRLEMVDWLQKNKPEYYLLEKEFFDDALFGILKIIANANINVADKLYLDYFRGKYHPSKSQTHSTKPYLLLFRLLGFKGVERIRKLLS